MNFDGSESIPDLNKATFLAFDDKTVPIDGSWIAEWRYPSGVVTRRIANRQGHTNIIFKMKLDPVPAGEACTFCWGSGRSFGDGATPESVTVVIEGVEKGPGWMPGDGEPPNGGFIMPQTILQACRFRLRTVDFDMKLRYAPLASTFEVEMLSPDVDAFFSKINPCETFFENEITDHFIGGTATVFIPPVA